jgi:hypothetical protein
MTSRSPWSIGPRRCWRPSPSGLPSAGPISHWRSSTRPRWPRRGPSTLDQRIAAALADSAGAMPFAALRSSCRVRAGTLYERLAALSDAGRVVKTDQGYRLRRQLITTPPTIRMTPAPSRRLPVPLPGHHYSVRERELGSPMDRSYPLHACPANALKTIHQTARSRLPQLDRDKRVRRGPAASVLSRGRRQASGLHRLSKMWFAECSGAGPQSRPSSRGFARMNMAATSAS